MRLKAVMVAGALALSGAVAPASAVELITNGSFESGLDGWTAVTEDWVQLTSDAPHFDAAHQRTDYYAADYIATGTSYDPDNPLQMAILTADAQDVATTLSQSFTLGPRGGFLSGWAAFLGGDYKPFGDFGFVHLLDDHGAVIDSLFDAAIGDDPGYDATPWFNFTRTLGAGTYTIQAGVVNVGDSEQASQVIFDRISVTAVPEPATWALILSGFFAMGLALRRRRLVPIRVRKARD